MTIHFLSPFTSEACLLELPLSTSRVQPCFAGIITILLVLQYLVHDLKFFRNIVCAIQGFAELEYGMLRYMGAIDDKTLIVTSGNYGISSLFLIHLLTVSQLSLPKCIILLCKYHFIVHIVNMYLLIGRIISLYLVSCLREK